MDIKKLFKSKKSDNSSLQRYPIGGPIFAFDEDKYIRCGIIRKVDRKEGRIIAYFESLRSERELIWRNNNWYLH